MQFCLLPLDVVMIVLFVLQVFAFQEEALLALRKYEEAETTLSNEPKFDTDASTKFFGASSTAYFLTVHAQVNMSLGRSVHVMTIKGGRGKKKE